jgi:hypothetical protein
MAPDKHRMGELHEQDLARLVGGRKSAASGATWKDPADGRASHMTEEFAFAFDGKATLGQGINVTREMLAKITEQAGGERPMIGLRFYGNERLDAIDYDWVAIRDHDFAELRECALSPRTLLVPAVTDDQLAEWEQLLADNQQAMAMAGEEIAQLRAELEGHDIVFGSMTAELAAAKRERDEAQEQLAEWKRMLDEEGSRAAAEAREEVIRLRAELAGLRASQETVARLAAEGPVQPPRLPPHLLASPNPVIPNLPPVEMWPCVLIEIDDDRAGRRTARGYYIEAGGLVNTFSVGQVRYEATAGGRPLLFHNDIAVRCGDLRINGVLQARVGVPLAPLPPQPPRQTPVRTG